MLNITNIDPAGWFDMAEAPRTGEVIEVFVPGKYDLPGFICDCAWTIEGGFCVDELREPVAWRRKAPKASPAPISRPSRYIVQLYRGSSGEDLALANDGTVWEWARNQSVAFGHPLHYAWALTYAPLPQSE